MRKKQKEAVTPRARKKIRQRHLEEARIKSGVATNKT